MMAPLRKTRKSGTAEERLQELRAALATAKMRERAAGEQLAAAHARVTDTRAERVEAHSRGDAERVAALAATYAEAVVDVTAAEDALAGAELASRRAADEVERYIAEHLGYIRAERAPGDQEAADAVEGALRAVLEAAKHWESRASESTALARAVPGEHPASIPDLGLGTVVRELRRILAGEGIATPSIRGRRDGWSIAATDSPDDAEREAARAAAEAA